MNILSEFYELEIIPGEILSWNLEFIFVLLSRGRSCACIYPHLIWLCFRILFDHYHTLDSVV
jgi:hypothetical protein